MNKQLVIPFVIGYEENKETFYFIVNYSDIQFKERKDIIQYIRNLENYILEEDIGFTIKNVCNFNISLNEYISMFQNLGYEVEDNKIIFDGKDRFHLWLYLINLVNDNANIYFEEIEFNDIEFRSEGNM